MIRKLNLLIAILAALMGCKEERAIYVAPSQDEVRGRYITCQEVFAGFKTAKWRDGHCTKLAYELTKYVAE